MAQSAQVLIEYSGVPLTRTELSGCHNKKHDPSAEWRRRIVTSSARPMPAAKTLSAKSRAFYVICYSVICHTAEYCQTHQPVRDGNMPIQTTIYMQSIGLSNT